MAPTKTKKKTAKAATVVGPGPTQHDDQARGDGDPGRGVGDGGEPGDRPAKRRDPRGDESGDERQTPPITRPMSRRPDGGPDRPRVEVESTDDRVHRPAGVTNMPSAHPARPP